MKVQMFTCTGFPLSENSNVIATMLLENGELFKLEKIGSGVEVFLYEEVFGNVVVVDDWCGNVYEALPTSIDEVKKMLLDSMDKDLEVTF